MYHLVKKANTTTHEVLTNVIQVNLVCNASNYLGLPTDWGESKANLYGSFQERMECKTIGWKSRLLSRVAKK